MKPKQLIFGDGKILVAPCTNSDGIPGIGLSTQLGTGKVNEKHPTMRKGDVFDPEKYDVILWFKNKESLEVLKWAVNQTMKG